MPRRADPTLRHLRYLLNELAYTRDRGGPIEDELAGEIEDTFRWLLDEYLRPGQHIDRQEN